MAAGIDPRLDELRGAVIRTRIALEAYRSPLTDRAVAERELAVMESLTDGMPRTGAAARAAQAADPEGAALRHSLLMIFGALGSVSALTPELGELRRAVDRFGVPAQRVPAAGRS
ncbi:DUF5955 family protein [Streptomyces aidingensis]|uniref:Uncharacterized protein n=1 Tax=Streptomyces aidingensis TaxID=910347 RepID=A0A1I1ITG2_9ACTN|nr:DUF5955 family protein [Streptomyces aidingensis]SFC39201.1 hypothetical protein SAMN05421773_103170 [Streptomyces aidingensis]